MVTAQLSAQVKNGSLRQDRGQARQQDAPRARRDTYVTEMWFTCYFFVLSARKEIACKEPTCFRGESASEICAIWICCYRVVPTFTFQADLLRFIPGWSLPVNLLCSDSE